MKKFMATSIIGAGVLCFSLVSEADHLQIPNFNSANNTLILPNITVDSDPNQEFTNVGVTLERFTVSNANAPLVRGTPDYQTIRVALNPAEEITENITSAGGCRGIVRVVNSTRAIEAAIICENVTDIIQAHIHNGSINTDGPIILRMQIDNDQSDNKTLIQLSRNDCTARTFFSLGAVEGIPRIEGSCLNPLDQDGDGTADGSIDARTQLTLDEYDAFLRGELYFNVHTATNKGGELRAQIIPEQRTITSLTACSQVEEAATIPVEDELNSVGTDYATCTASYTVDLETRVITGYVLPDTETTIIANGIHIHQQTAEQRIGPIIISLQPTENGKWIVPDNTVLESEQLAAFVANQTYTNVHTERNLLGATRTQNTPTLN